MLVAIIPVRGGLVAPRSVLDLEQTADLVVVGAAQGAFTVGTASSFSVQVSRVIKGDPTLAGNIIPVYWTGVPVTVGLSGTATASGSGLWFLQRGSSSSGWLLLPVIQGAVPLSMTYFPTGLSPVLSAYAYGSAASVSDKIASELCSAIESAPGGFGFAFPDAIYAGLDELQSPVGALFYQRMSSSSSVRQRIIGLSGLIRQDNEPALKAAVQGVSTFNAYALETSILQQSIRDYFRGTDANSIATLGQAAIDSTNPALSFREAVAHALSAIHTASSLPYLAALLEDGDSNLRVEAVGGIASFANGLSAQTAAGIPSLASLQLPPAAPYRTPETMAHFALGSRAIEQNEAAYLSFWKRWWADHRADLGF